MVGTDLNGKQTARLKLRSFPLSILILKNPAVKTNLGAVTPVDVQK